MECKFPKDEKYMIILLGLLVHVLLLLSIFDVYFSSPLDNGMRPIQTTNSPPAKRLVLFVADGLRAQALFGKENEDRAPFLTGILKNNGSWGVAHTRVPTESRPGHVAMLAGIYEDPSAILKGWKSNPVYFDSVVNQSSNAWCWGSPDIVNIFNRDNLPKIHLHTYESNMEDFGRENTAVLDSWVFDKVDGFLRNEVASCALNCNEYTSGGNMFFLHLLGIDTAGHGYKPYSKEYINNIKVVDERIRKTYYNFEATFKDSSTVYVFTADHGMTDWGSHGAGSSHETKVPIIAWGAGIKIDRSQNDINQIDIASLMASLIGINIPVNSLGVVPIDYLDTDSRNLGQIILSNTLQLLEIFNVKRLRTKENAFLYFPYKKIDDDHILTKVDTLKRMLNDGEYYKLVQDCEEFMYFIKEGIEYYHNYYQYPILLSVSAGFLLWISFLGITVININKRTITNYSRIKNRYEVLCLFIVLIFIICFKSKAPITYYLYFSFPFVMFFVVYRKVKLYDKSTTNFISAVKRNTVNIIFYLAGLELIVYGFFNRLGFTILMLLVSLWVVASKILYSRTNAIEKTIWIGTCVVLSIFPTLPVMKTSFNVPMYIVGYIGWLVVFIKIYLKDFKLYDKLPNLNLHIKIFLIQFSCLTLAAVYVLLIEYEYIPNDSTFKYLSWFLFVIPLLVIPLTTQYIAIRLVATFFGFAPFYLLVSSNFEVLFSLFYVVLLCTWLLIETKTFNCTNYKIVYFSKFENYESKNGIDGEVFRRALLFVIFIFLGFFGTGNIASLNSFDPMWVRAFLTIFSPFKMTGIILLKLTVPFIFTCCVFKAINAVGRENVLGIFCIILMFSDLMVLQFTYLITNVGSWLDIGTSLSHFIIMETFVTILLLLYAIAHWLTTVKYFACHF